MLFKLNDKDREIIHDWLYEDSSCFVEVLFTNLSPFAFLPELFAFIIKHSLVIKVVRTKLNFYTLILYYKQMYPSSILLKFREINFKLKSKVGYEIEKAVVSVASAFFLADINLEVHLRQFNEFDRFSKTEGMYRPL